MTTRDYMKQHELKQHELTVKQRNAIDLLVTGKNDTETAEAVGCNRVTVTKWRLYDPWFIAELNARRAEIWSAAKQRLPGLLRKAFDAIEADLDAGANRGRIGLELLKLAGVADVRDDIGPTDAAAIMAGKVQERITAMQAERNRHLSKTGRMLQEMKNPSPEDYARDEREAAQEIWSEVEALSREEDTQAQ